MHLDTGDVDKTEAIPHGAGRRRIGPITVPDRRRTEGGVA